MLRATLLCTALLAVFGNVAIVQADDKEDAMQAWASFVGDWSITLPNGNTTKSSITHAKSKSCFIHQSDNVTYIVGWDPAKKALKSVMFAANGGHGVGYWKVTGDGPTLTGEIEGVGADGEQRSSVTITIEFQGKDAWEMTVGDSKLTAERVK